MEIRLQEITKAFGEKRVIAPTTFTIPSGKFTTLLGPSGCGKTTLLRMIAGLETPDTGEIWFDDRCVFSAANRVNLPPEKRGLGFVFQDFALWPHMTVFENVAFGLRAQKRAEHLKENVMEALRRVHLEDLAQRYPHQLSGGQQQRVAIARALCYRPSLLLADEPTGNLDRRNSTEILDLLRLFHRNLNQTILLVTHDEQLAAQADRVITLSDGQIVSDVQRR